LTLRTIIRSRNNPTAYSATLSLALSGEASAEAVRLILAGSGGNAHRLSQPLQRIQRDVNVLLNHASLTMDRFLEQAGRGLLGLGFTIPAF
jgi:GTP cyclohydrolase II